MLNTTGIASSERDYAADALIESDGIQSSVTHKLVTEGDPCVSLAILSHCHYAAGIP
jgi:hypothetical protein